MATEVKTYQQLAEDLLKEIELHNKTWKNNGFDRIRVFNIDLQAAEKLLAVLEGKLPQLKIWLENKFPAVESLDDFVLILQGAVELTPGLVLPIPSAVLVAYSQEAVVWSSNEDGSLRDIDDGLTQGCFVWGVSARAREELCSKVLAGAGLVPYRHGESLPEDLDHDGLYWIEFQDGGSYRIKDA